MNWKNKLLFQLMWHFYPIQNRDSKFCYATTAWCVLRMWMKETVSTYGRQMWVRLN